MTHPVPEELQRERRRTKRGTRATARQLRAIVEALPPTTARDRATARQVQGALAADLTYPG